MFGALSALPILRQITAMGKTIYQRHWPAGQDYPVSKPYISQDLTLPLVLTFITAGVTEKGNREFPTNSLEFNHLVFV